MTPSVPRRCGVTLVLTLSLVLITLLSPSAAAAQTPGSLPKLSELPASTRAMALGDAYMIGAGQPDALYYHPALLTGSSGLSVDMQRWGPDTNAASVTAATQWFGGDIGVAVGLRTLQYSAPAPGVAAAPPGQDHLFEIGGTPVSERIAVLGVSRGILGFEVGASVKLLEERVGGVRAAVTRVDIGAAHEIGPLTLAVTLQDWGYEPVGPRGDVGPARAVYGLGSYGWEVGILDIGATATASVSDGNTWFGGGVEVGYWPLQGRTIVARLGFRGVPEGDGARPVTLGLAYWGDTLIVEWGFHPVADAPDGGTHRLSIGWR